MYDILLEVSFTPWIEGFGRMVAFALIALAPEITKWTNRQLKSKTNYFVKSINTRKQINDEINEIRIRLGADRVVVFEFSNTDKSISNFPFEFLNATFEKTNPHIMDIKDSFQKKHINPYVDFLQMLSANDVLFKILHPRDPNIPESLGLRLDQWDIKTCIVFKLASELRLGFIAVHFIGDPYTEDWDMKNGQHEDLRFMKMKAMNVLTLMKSLQ